MPRRASERRTQGKLRLPQDLARVLVLLEIGRKSCFWPTFDRKTGSGRFWPKQKWFWLFFGRKSWSWSIFWPETWFWSISAGKSCCQFWPKKLVMADFCQKVWWILTWENWFWLILASKVGLSRFWRKKRSVLAGKVGVRPFWPTKLIFVDFGGKGCSDLSHSICAQKLHSAVLPFFFVVQFVFYSVNFFCSAKMVL